MNMFGKKNTKKRHDSRQVKADELIGKNLNFSATEAYKLLRTNLFFCLPPSDESKCPVVGVTSSVQGEGKSTTSVNLAYMLAEDGKRVCLIEGDMRAPTLRKRLNINNSVGLSHVLAGLETVQSAISAASIQENLRVITAGEMPPNPAELLGSERMVRLVSLLKKAFDYVVVDLPPITVVADALAVSAALDGMVVVVEDGVCTKRELTDAMQRLDVISEKILGFVVTHAETAGGRYGKKRYGNRYGYGYGYGYGNNYNENEREA